MHGIQLNEEMKMYYSTGTKIKSSQVAFNKKQVTIAHEFYKHDE